MCLCFCSLQGESAGSGMTVESGAAWVVGILANPDREEEGLGTEIPQLNQKRETTCTRN